MMSAKRTERNWYQIEDQGPFVFKLYSKHSLDRMVGVVMQTRCGGGGG